MAKNKIIENGNITSPRGFHAGGIHSGIKKHDDLDLAILYSEVPCTASGVFTKNVIKAPSIIIDRQVIKNKVQAIVANSGCANACTGEQGMKDALKTTNIVAKKLNVPSTNIIVASTGVIGEYLPMEKIMDGIRQIALNKQDGGNKFTHAIMTTDTFAKEIALQVNSNSYKFIIGGTAKGAGMIHPNMATMLCFITTDAHVEPEFLNYSLKRAVNDSFNMTTVDGDTSTNDMVIVLANGLAGNKEFNRINGKVFYDALSSVCNYLAKCVARDGEGATKLLEVTVEGADNKHNARLTARTIAGSPLVKTAMYGNDPNWGRIAAAAGRSGARIIEEKLDIYLNSVLVLKQGMPQPFNKEKLSHSLADDTKTIPIKLCLNLGHGKATAWGCDLSQEYVNINSAYTT